MKAAPSVDAEFDLKFRRAIEWVNDRQFNKEWQLKVLSQVEPDHVLFSKTYTGEVPERPSWRHNYQVENPNGFFQHLPPSTARGRRGLNLLGKDAADSAALERLHEQMGKLQKRAKNLRDGINRRQMEELEEQQLLSEEANPMNRPSNSNCSQP